jgi:Asparagine synthase
MLSLHLDLADIAEPAWRWDTDRWRTGSSWIRPLAHPVLGHELRHEGENQVVVRVREKTAAGEHTTVRMSRGTVQLEAGRYGTAPIYLAAAGPILDAAWDITALAPSCRGLLDRAVVRAITRRYRYSTDTPFPGVRRLTERAVATFTRAGLTIAYPSPAHHVIEARTLSAGTDPVDAFDAVLAAVITQHLTGAGAGVELSGGVDSANVAKTIADLAPGSGSIGLVLGGDIGQAQARRRATIVNRFGLRDTTVAAHEHPPFRGDTRTGPHDPCGDTYLEAFTALAAAAARHGVRILFTGFGGDELLAPRPDERTQPPPQPPDVPWLGPRGRAALPEINANTAPVAPVPLPSLLGFAARNPTYLRHGIWPVSPLVDPLMVRFGESLPWGWRHGKLVARERLRRAGLPATVTHPTVPEHFLDLMQHGLRHHGLAVAHRMLAHGSILIEAGFVDPDAFTRAVQGAGNDATVPGVLYDTIATETGISAMMAG